MCESMLKSIKTFLKNAVFTPVEGEDWGLWEDGNISVQGWPDRKPSADAVEDALVDEAFYSGLEAMGAW